MAKDKRGQKINVKQFKDEICTFYARQKWRGPVFAVLECYCNDNSAIIHFY